MKNKIHSTQRFSFRALASGALISSTLLFGGCTHNQQDYLLTEVVSIGRNSADLEVKTAPAGDVNLTYMERQSTQKENAESIILVHGFSANKDNWILFTKALDKKYHVIAVDLAGHGDSEQLLTTDYSLVKQAERLDTFLTGLGVNSFHIAGNSMGGAISAIYSLNHPEKIKSLTLIDAAGVDGDTTSEYFKSLAEGENPLIATDEESFEYRMDITMSQPPFLPWPLRPALLRKTLAREEINKKIFADMIATKEDLGLNSFKQKIESFQNNIINEKLKEYISQHKSVSDKIRALDDKRAQMLSLIDKQGIFKNLKQSFAIYHQKSEESSNVRTQLKRYDSNTKDKNRLKSQKSIIVTRIDDQIVNNEKVLTSFNGTLAQIHNEIMGNKGCSFDMVTVNRDSYKDVIKFDMTIDYGGSHSVERVKVFIYDLSLLLNEYTSKKHPSFLVHDNIFDVDQDTLLQSLNYLYTLNNPETFQYVLTLNSDKLSNQEANDRLLFDVHDYARAIFTKSDRFIKGDKYSEV